MYNRVSSTIDKVKRKENSLNKEAVNEIKGKISLKTSSALKLNQKLILNFGY
jgi:hypothetical protein